MNLNELKILSNGARKEFNVDYKDSAEYRFLSKDVYDRLVIYDGRDLENVSLTGRGSLSLSPKMSPDEKMILCVTTNTEIENVTPRPYTILNFSIKNHDLSRYNRVHVKLYIEATGYQSFYYHFLFGNDGAQTNHAPAIEPNKWVDIVWECDHIARDNVQTMSITPFLMGCPDEALPQIRIYIDSITMELVNKEFDEGWELGKQISYSHPGYLPQFKKEAITGVAIDDYFYLVNEDTEKATKYKVKVQETNLGKFYILDFSNMVELGNYHIEIDDRKTESFPIDYQAYDSSIWKSLNFLRSLRCGCYVEGVHSACHLNCKTVHPENGKTVPNFGGWHDAGDVSQFEICTAEMANALCDLGYTLRNDTFLYDRILEEARVGLDWLLQTRFKDGYRAMAVLYNFWRHNAIDKDNVQVLNNKAERGSFENFLSSAALASGAKVFENQDKIYSEYLKRSAIEDFNFALDEYKNGIYTVRWGKPIVSQTLGSLLLAASNLYEITNNKEYLDIAYSYSKELMACQEVNKEFKLRGFFYEDPEHNYILSYEHRGHEQSPIQGLVRLYTVSPIEYYDAKNTLMKSIELYRDYVINSMQYSKPYDLLPAGVYHLDKINLDHFTISPKMEREVALEILRNQVKSGIDLGNGYFLRLMPIAISRRGYHATLLSKTKAVSMIAKLLNDQKLKNIVKSQIEWILGKNPFSSSTMYGEGHNYHNLYVAFSRQIIGALPVGIKTRGDKDEPFWPTINNAVYKEIWGHTTGKYLWVLSDLL